MFIIGFPSSLYNFKNKKIAKLLPENKCTIYKFKNRKTNNIK